MICRLASSLRRMGRAVLSCYEGLAVTFGYLFHHLHLRARFRPTTVGYQATPETREANTVQPRFRGHLYIDIEKCTACGACARACPDLLVVHDGRLLLRAHHL